MALRFAGIIIGGTLGGYISGKIGEYIYKKKLPQIENNIENNIEINQIPVSSSDDTKKIKSFKELLNDEIKMSSNEKVNKIETNISNTNEIEIDNYFNNYLKALENEKKKQQEKEMLFINDSLYDNDYYDYIMLVAK